MQIEETKLVTRNLLNQRKIDNTMDKRKKVCNRYNGQLNTIQKTKY